MGTLKELDTKLEVIKLDAEGKNGREIMELTSVPQSTSNDFLRKQSWVSWWRLTKKKFR